MNWKFAALPLVLLAPACATTVPEESSGGETISFEAGPCFGFCPTFSFSVSADGQGTYRGARYVAEKGEHRFMVTPAQFEAFRTRVAPYRPVKSVSYGTDNCDGPVATDSPSLKIGWAGGGEPVVLEWYMGCRQPGLVQNAERISRAWNELPQLVKLVGDDQKRSSYEGS